MPEGEEVEDLKDDLPIEDAPTKEEEGNEDLPAGAVDENDQYLEVLNSRFNGDPLEAVKAFRNAESMIGSHGDKMGKYRAALEELGYEFDDGGMPVKPKPVEQPKPAEEVRTPVQGTSYVEDRATGKVFEPSTGRSYDPKEDFTGVDGKQYHTWRDKYGTKEITEEEWNWFRENHPERYNLARGDWERERDRNIRNWEDAQEKRARELVPRHQAEFQAELAKVPLFNQAATVKNALETAKNDVAMLPFEQQADPRAYASAVFLRVMQDPVAFANELVAIANEAARNNTGTNPKIIATQTSGTQNGAMRQQAQESANQLTQEQDAERRKFNARLVQQGQKPISAKDWAANAA